MPQPHQTVGASARAATPDNAPAAERLRADVQGYLDEAEAVAGREIVPRRAHAVVVPHATLGLSGPTAGVAFASVDVPGSVVLLAPAEGTDRAPAGSPGALLARGPSRTPLGELAADRALAEAILRAGGGAVTEDGAVAAGLDAVLPFIQVLNAAAHIVAIAVPWDDWEPTERLARAIATAIDGRGDVLVVAASNMTRGEAADVAKDRDALALGHVVALDGAGLLDAVRREGVSMSGAAAVACACEVARLRGARGAELVAYSHSGIVTGDMDGVTGYAGVVLGGA